MHPVKRSRLVFFLILLGIGRIGFSEEKKSSEGLYQEIDLFTKVLTHVQNDYVEQFPDKKLIYGAIQGMLATLDPHSAFLPPEVYDELRVDTEGWFGGVGIEVTVKENILTVVSPLEGTPAQKGGIREGDKILKIDNSPTDEMTLSDAVRKMRGRKGSKITLTLQRAGVKEPFSVTLTRDIVRVRSARSELLEGVYGYVRITSFQSGTHKELLKELRSLEKKVGEDKSLGGLILDLRNNPGGLLEEALEITDTFLKEGLILSTMSRNQEVDKREAHNNGNEPDYPVIVLINGGSASASEIVAGALQDHGRGVILGTQSFGKGSVQTIFEIGRGAALKLTVARYYTPSGRSIQVEGIKPDVIVATPESAKAITLEKGVVREKDLRGHLKQEKKGVPGIKGEGPETAEEDFQKQAALNYLKSWAVFGRPARGDGSPRDGSPRDGSPRDGSPPGGSP